MTTPKSYVVRRSKIHGLGVYAARDIRKGERIIEYIGEKITKAESERRGTALLERAKKTGEGAVYMFILNKRYDIDGNVPENDARLLNHSCDPNCEAHIIDNRIWYVALRAIACGEELTLNYNFDVENWDDHPCRCGSARCVGFIVAEDQWPKLRRLIEKQKAAAIDNSAKKSPPAQRHSVKKSQKPGKKAARKSTKRAVGKPGAGKKVGRNVSKPRR